MTATVTKRDIWTYLSEGEPDANPTLQATDLKEIIADEDMSTQNLGGDDMVSLANDILAAIAEGYTILTWYGDNAEALVVGYRPDQLTVTD